jgi:hypothetical protein
MNHASATAASNMIAWGALTSSLAVATNDIPQFAANTLVLTAD